MKTKKTKNKPLSEFLRKQGPSVRKFEQINLLFGGSEAWPGTHDLYGEPATAAIYEGGGRPSKPS
jgi:hypothetical protein